ncbi:MAG: S1C family serine protease [Bacillota bacterium]|nr:S1C family serine protease [Bacillota bacterium]
MIYIGVSICLINDKPDISGVKEGKVAAEFTQPAIVRVANIVTLSWYIRDNCSEDNSILGKYDYSSDVVVKGTGFIINPNGYLVTNAHAVQYSKMNDDDIVNCKDIISDNDRTQVKNSIIEKFAKDIDEDSECVIDDLNDKGAKLYIKVIKKEIKVILQSGDAYCGEIKSYGNPIALGKDVAVLKIEKKNLPTIKLGDSDKVQLQDDVLLWGYPAASDCLFLSEKSKFLPTIIPGAISSVDKKSEQCVAVYTVAAAVAQGGSEGPVIGEDSKVIGLIISGENAGYNRDIYGQNFVIPANTVKEFVDQSGGKNEQGLVDKLYKEGLILYWSGYYKDALVKFERVQRLLPDHPQVKKYIAQCEQNSCKSKILWCEYKTIFIITDVAAAIVIIVLVAIVLKCNKRKCKRECK